MAAMETSFQRSTYFKMYRYIRLKLIIIIIIMSGFTQPILIMVKNV